MEAEEGWKDLWFCCLRCRWIRKCATKMKGKPNTRNLLPFPFLSGLPLISKAFGECNGTTTAVVIFEKSRLGMRGSTPITEASSWSRWPEVVCVYAKIPSSWNAHEPVRPLWKSFISFELETTIAQAEEQVSNLLFNTDYKTTRCTIYFYIRSSTILTSW